MSDLLLTASLQGALPAGSRAYYVLERADRLTSLASAGRFNLAARGRRWTSLTAILADAPEVDGKQYREHQRQADDMQGIEADQRGLADANRTAGEDGVRLGAEQRRVAGHIGADGDGPVADLVPRQEVAGEAQQEGGEKEDHANHPVELTRRLIGAMVEDADHVQRDGDDHQVRGPAVHVAHQLAEGDGAVDLLDVAIGDALLGDEIEHQEDAGDGQHQEEEERETA